MKSPGKIVLYRGKRYIAYDDDQKHAPPRRVLLRKGGKRIIANEVEIKVVGLVD